MKGIAFCLAIVFALTSSLTANDGVYYTSGSFLVPLKETDISVKREVLEITLCKDNFASVTVDYTFYNNGEDKTVVMAFEARPSINAWAPFNRQGIHPFIEDFTVLFNGLPLQHRNAVVAMNDNDKEKDNLTPLDLTDWKGFGEVADTLLPMDNVLVNPAQPDSFCSFAYAYYFDAPFRKGENTVRHTYRYRMNNSVWYDYEVDYWLTPVTRWANGQADDFTLRIKSEDFRDIILKDSIFLGTPFKMNGIGDIHQLQTDYFAHGRQYLFAELKPSNVLEWHGTDFAPTEDLCIFPLNVLEDMNGISTKGRVVIDKDGHVARYIADSGDNYFVMGQDYGLVPKDRARVVLREAAKGEGFVYLKSNIQKGNVRQEPSLKGQVLLTIENDGEMPKSYPCLGFVSHKEADGFYKWWYKVDVNGTVGYISERIAAWNPIQY